MLSRKGRPPPVSPAELTLQLQRTLGQPALSFSCLLNPPPPVTSAFIPAPIALLLQKQLLKTRLCPCIIYRNFTLPFNHLPSNTLKPETNSPAQHLPHPTALFITKSVIQQPAPHSHHYVPTSKHCFKYQSLPKS